MVLVLFVCVGASVSAQDSTSFKKRTELFLGTEFYFFNDQQIKDIYGSSELKGKAGLYIDLSEQWMIQGVLGYCFGKGEPITNQSTIEYNGTTYSIDAQSKYDLVLSEVILDYVFTRDEEKIMYVGVGLTSIGFSETITANFTSAFDRFSESASSEFTATGTVIVFGVKNNNKERRSIYAELSYRKAEATNDFGSTTDFGGISIGGGFFFDL